MIDGWDELTQEERDDVRQDRLHGAVGLAEYHEHVWENVELDTWVCTSGGRGIWMDGKACHRVTDDRGRWLRCAGNCGGSYAVLEVCEVCGLGDCKRCTHTCALPVWTCTGCGWRVPELYPCRCGFPLCENCIHFHGHYGCGWRPMVK